MNRCFPCNRCFLSKPAIPTARRLRAASIAAAPSRS
jgi:hypothetical protein